MNTNWEIPLFTIGDYKICLFSYLMAPCAMAYARSQLDDSNIVFNLSCTCLPLNRWLIRTAYGINGDTMEDVATSVCCFPCTVNQMLHTTIARGNPTSDGGMLQNFEKWEVPLNKVHTKGTYYNGANILYSLFCFPCAVGTAMENSVGTPFWFGMCCITLPWTARNIMRYQYRIDGDDFVEDCAFPTSCCLLSFIYYQLCPSCMPTLYPYPIGLMPAQLLAEAEVRGPTMQPVYLARTATAFTKEGGTSAFLNESESTYGASGDGGESEVYHDTI